MADTRNRAPSPPRGVRNRSRERDRIKERDANENKDSVDREKVVHKYGLYARQNLKLEIAIIYPKFQSSYMHVFSYFIDLSFTSSSIL